MSTVRDAYTNVVGACRARRSRSRVVEAVAVCCGPGGVRSAGLTCVIARVGGCRLWPLSLEQPLP